MSISHKINHFPNNEFLLITILSTILVISLFFLGKFLTPGIEFVGDSAVYIQMSYQPFNYILAPFSYRILTPLIVYLLPLKHYMGFIVVNLTATIGTSILLYYYLKKLNIVRIYRIIGTLFFLFSPSVLYSLLNINLVDPLSYLFFLLAFYAILTKDDKLFLIAVVLGVFNKETILLVIPLFFIFKLDRGILKALKSTLIVSLPGLMIFVILRYFYGLVNYLSLDNISSITSYHLSPNIFFNNPFPAFGTLWIISLFNLIHIESSFIKKAVYLIPLIILQIFIATDTFKVLFLAFPIIIPLSLYLYKTKDNKIILLFIILSITILISYLFMFSQSHKPYLVIYIFLPLEILIIGFLLSLFARNILSNEIFKINIVH